VEDRHRLAVRKAADQIASRLAELSKGQLADLVSIVSNSPDEPKEGGCNLLVAVAGFRRLVEGFPIPVEQKRA